MMHWEPSTTFSSFVSYHPPEPSKVRCVIYHRTRDSLRGHISSQTQENATLLLLGCSTSDASKGILLARKGEADLITVTVITGCKGVCLALDKLLQP
ncbi:hypothetical protein CEXT_366081 [Caerostris extrusa]|uniref:Uncharacterized protein n=1 Tax=Caerostris extrusa TaxID=172846 RepID=A0AAV4TIK2_CAEEX|nr:hypothetical protein CEXT_366081 [Caerostris extrusa]